MYEVQPPKDIFSRVLLGVLLGGAVVLLVLGVYMGEGGRIWLTAALCAAVAALLVGTRFVMTSYVYSLEYTEGRDRAVGPDLVITEVRGKKRQVVCRVAAAGGKLEKADPNRSGRANRSDDERDPTTATGTPGEEHNYAASLLGTGAWWFYPTAADGGGRIKFTPDDRLVELLRRVNGE